MPTPPDVTVIDCLQNAVSLHLTAIEHYTAVAEHLGRIGYKKLHARFIADADEERGHLCEVMARLEFYNTQPTYQHVAPSFPRYDVQGIIAASLTLETNAAAAERQHIVMARAVGDELTAAVFADLLAGSEASVRDLEADRFLVSQIGLDNYLANQT